MPNTTLLTALAGAVFAAQAPATPVQEAVTGGAIPVDVVGGRLIASCDVATSANRIPVNLFLEFEGKHGLQLHNRAAASLRAESADGTPRPIAILFPDFTIDVERRELGDEDLFEEFTKYHSHEIGETALVGSIGVEVLRDWTVTFDLGRGEVRLAPPIPIGQGGAPPPTTTFVEDDGTVVAPLTLVDDMAWLPVRWNEGEPAGVMLGTSRFDTRIDERLARSVGNPAGDVGAIRIGNVDLAEYVAFRPTPIVQVHPDRALGITGINLLESLEVTVDRERRTLRLRPTKDAEFPTVDLEFFRAQAEDDPEQLEAFLDAHPDARLAHEAAESLLNYRLEDGAGEDAVGRAVEWMSKTTAEDLRTTRLLDLMKEMADAGEPDVVVAAGEFAIDAGRDDRYPNAVHHVHGLLGRTLLDLEEADDAKDEEAWKHLLSAAFGLPEDGRINYDLGRFYERQKRFRRAYSRYVQAVIRPEAGGEAIEALQRVQPLLVDDAGQAEPFSVDAIEKMIAGKVRSFGAASKYESTDEEPAFRTVLCEFFTNGHYGNEERGGAIGGALGIEGLSGHFEREHVVFLSYHLPVPRPDSLCNHVGEARAAVLGVEKPNVIVADGVGASPGAAKWREAEAVYERARSNIVARLGTLDDFEIDAEAWLEDGQVAGTVTVFGPEEDDLEVQVIISEAGVLYPGGSGIVVHRHVARASALPGGQPVPFEPNADEEMIVDFGIFFDDIERLGCEYLEALEADGVGSAPRISMRMDPNQTRVVAYLRNRHTGEVHAACQVTPDGVEGDEPPSKRPSGEDR